MPSRLSLCLLAALALAACDNLGIGGAPDELTIDVEATGTSQVTLITSTKWYIEQDPTCDPTQPGGCPEIIHILSADTADVDAPYRQTLRFNSDYKYLVEAFPAGGVTATVKMQIDIDGKEWFFEERELSSDGANGQETLQFIYQWKEPTLR